MLFTAYNCQGLSTTVRDCHHFATFVAGQQIYAFGQQMNNKYKQKRAIGQQIKENKTM